MTLSPLAVFRKKRKSSFTLIELLITIAIIGILSVIGLSAFLSAQKKARDFNRKAGLTSVTKALESYMNDTGQYPPSSPDGKILWCGTSESPDSESCAWGASFTGETDSGEKTVYMAVLPKEPVQNQNYYYKSITIDGKIKGYQLFAKLENTYDAEVSGPYGTLTDGIKCQTGADMTCNYVLTSDTVEIPETCSISGSACAGSECCAPNTCSTFYSYTVLSGYTDNCTPKKFCGNPNAILYTATIGKSNGQACTGSLQCCSGFNTCTTFYKADSNCTQAKFCGTTPPTGYMATAKTVDGQACSNGTTCCSGACTTFYKDNTATCTSAKLCGTTPPAGYLTAVKTVNGQACSVGSDCCSGACTTFYKADSSCTQAKFCGTTAPSGYYATVRSVNGASCSSNSNCCSNACTTFYKADSSCTQAKFCGTTAPSGYMKVAKTVDGQACSNATSCCSGACTTFYKADSSCTATKLCGRTPPSGYYASVRKADGQACTGATECCSGTCNTFYAQGSCTATKLCGTTPPSGYGTTASCGPCRYANGSFVPAGSDPNNNCTASYTACSGNNKIGPDGNCNGAGACNTGGLSAACATAGICQTGGGCSGGNCVAVTHVAAGTDPNNHCASFFNACGFYNIKGFSNTKIGPDGNCNGAGACNTGGLSEACPVMGICRTYGGCSNGTCLMTYVPYGQDPRNNCPPTKECMDATQQAKLGCMFGGTVTRTRTCDGSGSCINYSSENVCCPRLSSCVDGVCTTPTFPGQ